MKTVSGFSNVYNEDKIYIGFRKNIEINDQDLVFTRKIKEAFKCRFSSDLCHLVHFVDLWPHITIVPNFIYKTLNSGKYPGSSQVIKCMFSYYNNKGVWNTYCSVERRLPKKLRRNANCRFSEYFKKVYNDAKKELSRFRRSNNVEQINNYRVALLFFKIVIRVFYFSALPISITTQLYQKCLELDEKFAEFYVFDQANHRYNRKEFKKRGMQYFNENIAWLLVNEALVRYRLV